MADDNAREKNAGCAESDAAESETSERHAEHADKRERADGMGDWRGLMEFEKPVHESAAGWRLPRGCEITS